MSESILIDELKKYKPELYDVTRYYASYREFSRKGQEKCPLIGEEKSALTTFLSLIMSGCPILVRAYSGTGKTVLIDATMSLLKEDDGYTIEMGSDKSIWYQAEKIKLAKVIEFPEVQEATQNFDTLAVMKKWGDGKDAHRERADMIGTVVSGEDTTIEQKLEWKPFITSLAYHNLATNLEKDEEFLRRVVEIHTDPSKEMTRRVLNHKLNSLSEDVEDKGLKKSEMYLLRNHVGNCLMQNRVKGYYFPPSPDTYKKIIVMEFPIVRSKIDYLISVMCGITKFYHKDRIFHKGKLLITPADFYMALEIYLEEFVESCLKMPALGRIITDIYGKQTSQGTLYGDAGDEGMTIAELTAQMQAIGYTLEKFKVRSIIGHLLQNCVLEEVDDTKPKRYRRTRFSLTRNLKIDWDTLVQNAVKNVAHKRPPNVAKDYIERFCDDEIWVIHPTTGEKVNIYDTMNGVEEKSTTGDIDFVIETKEELEAIEEDKRDMKVKDPDKGYLNLD